jgi:Putative zincin peptidase
VTPELNESPPPASQGGQQVPEVVDWRPGASEASIWSFVGVVVTLVGLPLFALPSILRAGPAGGTFRIGLGEILLVVALTAVLVIAHEAIHGLVMLAFGARPRFGAILVGRVMPAVYATSEGHRFNRGQYLTVAVAPAITISLLGFWACFGPWAGYLILPLALHLGGCVGDGFAFWRVLRERPGTEYEDLRDGIRFHRLPA